MDLAITSNEALDLPRLPKSILIVGGGYIGLEFAGIFNGLGSKVTVGIRRDLVLAGFDQDIRLAVTKALNERGIAIQSGHVVSALRRDGDRVVAVSDSGEATSYDCVMYATGRLPDSRNMGLEEVGVELDDDGGKRVRGSGQTRG